MHHVAYWQAAASAATERKQGRAAEGARKGGVWGQVLTSSLSEEMILKGRRQEVSRDFPCGPFVKNHLAMQDAGSVLGQELRPTRCAATKPKCCSSWACEATAPEPSCRSRKSRTTQGRSCAL